MARNKELHEKRNEAIKKAYNTIKQQQPKWRYAEWINYLSEKFFLDPKTIQNILNNT